MSAVPLQPVVHVRQSGWPGSCALTTLPATLGTRLGSENQGRLSLGLHTGSNVSVCTEGRLGLVRACADPSRSTWCQHVSVDRQGRWAAGPGVQRDVQRARALPVCHHARPGLSLLPSACTELPCPGIWGKKGNTDGA